MELSCLKSKHFFEPFLLHDRHFEWLAFHWTPMVLEGIVNQETVYEYFICLEITGLFGTALGLFFIQHGLYHLVRGVPWFRGETNDSATIEFCECPQYRVAGPYGFRAA
jgi:hypothetical protein